MVRERNHYSIGVVQVRLESVCRFFLNEYRSLYAAYQCASSAPNAIKVEILPRHRLPVHRGPYTLRSGSTPDFDVARRYEVLPHLEWYINWQIIHRRRDYLQIHASVLERDGQALMLPGNPGSGKSTLTAGLLTRGWSYLCDEFALIDPATLMVHPFPRALCMKEASFPVIDGLGVRLCRKTPYQKAVKGRVAFLNPLDIRPDIVGLASPVRWVVFPHYVPGATPRLQPMGSAQAAFELAQLCFNFNAHDQRAVPTLAGVVRDAHGYRLTAGSLPATCDLLESRLLCHTHRKAG